MPLIRKSPTPTDAPPASIAMPETLDAVDAALSAIETERAAVMADLASLPTQEDALLDRDADDAAFVALDIRKKRHERTLARLDARQTQIERVGERLHAEAHQAAYAAVRESYIARSRTVAETAARLEREIAELQQVANHAAQAGFIFAGAPVLPPLGYSTAGRYLTFGPHLRVLKDQVRVGTDSPARVPQVPPRLRLETVRFLKWTTDGRTAYQSGQIAGFPTREARRLVDGGFAEPMCVGMKFNPTHAVFGAGAVPPPKPVTLAALELEDV